MIYLKGIYDSGSKKMIIEFKNGLLENYFDVLENCVKESKSRGILPDDLEVQNLEDSRCLITFHIDIPEAQGMKDGQRIKKSSSLLSAEWMSSKKYTGKSKLAGAKRTINSQFAPFLQGLTCSSLPELAFRCSFRAVKNALVLRGFPAFCHSSSKSKRFSSCATE